MLAKLLSFRFWPALHCNTGAVPTTLAGLPAHSVDVSREHRLLGAFLLSLLTELTLIFQEYPFSDDREAESPDQTPK